MEETKEYTFSKTEKRKELLSLRASVTDKIVKARAATDNILPLLSGNVMVYIPIGSELSTLPLITALNDISGVTLFAPHTAGDIITPKKLISVGTADRYGNMPIDCYGDCGKIDICVTPLLGIDGKGYRLGYGKGCYDRFFAGFTGVKIGFCFSEQFTEFAHSAHDVPLDVCVTEKNVIYFSHASDCGKV
ncbi:MAG: 5-formyltetrahydrofolate cyclo-ligase [Clostridiales bacterium]|nr:5-formyltetrahydrofolate cyclo-ligase [Clostridiales bacterium]